MTRVRSCGDAATEGPEEGLLRCPLYGMTALYVLPVIMFGTGVTILFADRKWLEASICAAACIVYAVVGWKRLHGKLTDTNHHLSLSSVADWIIRVPQAGHPASRMHPCRATPNAFPAPHWTPHLAAFRASSHAKRTDRHVSVAGQTRGLATILGRIPTGFVSDPADRR